MSPGRLDQSGREGDPPIVNRTTRAQATIPASLSDRAPVSVEPLKQYLAWHTSLAHS
jgi:hypothetical protein